MLMPALTMLAACTVALAACGGGSSSKGTGGSAPATMNIGVIYPFTGANADQGAIGMAGCLAGVAEVNAAGGVLGGKFTCKPSDTKGDPADAVSAANQLMASAQPVMVIVASDDAVFGLTEVSLGIIPGGGGTQSLPRLIGRNRAKELIFSARRIRAAEALELGLVNHVVPRAELLPKATALAEEIMKNSPFAVRQAKWAIDRGSDLTFEDGLQREHEAYMRAIGSEDRREGIAAFNERRPPHFSGR